MRRPEELTPGNPLHFATGYALEGYTSGLLVESHEGHPTKIEGNPAHPETLGATTATEQALILGLYDDDRAKQLRRGSTPIAWPTFLAELKARSASLAANGGAGLRFLTGPTTSPLWPTCAAGSWSASRARSSSAIRRSPPTARSTGPSWPSAAR